MNSALMSLFATASLVAGVPSPAGHGVRPRPVLSMHRAPPAPVPAPTPAPTQPSPPAPTAPAPAPTAPAEPDGPPAAAPAPTINVNIQPPAPAVPSAPAPPPPVTAGRGLIITGGVMTGVGAASLLLVAAPAAIVRNVALNRASNDEALTFDSARRRFERARRADDTMEAAFWIGTPLVLGGVAVLVTGIVVRNGARNRQSRVAATPSGLSVRF